MWTLNHSRNVHIHTTKNILPAQAYANGYVITLSRKVKHYSRKR